MRFLKLKTKKKIGFALFEIPFSGYKSSVVIARRKKSYRLMFSKNLCTSVNVLVTTRTQFRKELFGINTRKSNANWFVTYLRLTEIAANTSKISSSQSLFWH